MPPGAKKTDPQIVEMPPQRMAVVTARGEPGAQMERIMPALYGAVYTLKFARKKQGLGDFKVGPLRARWPDAHLLPRDEWTAIWGLPVPDDVTELVQKVPAVEVTTETWLYGLVAQILHLGPYAEEGPTVERLHAFISEGGYALAGHHEEEYLTKPDASVVKTIIRYQVSKG